MLAEKGVNHGGWHTHTWITWLVLPMYGLVIWRLGPTLERVNTNGII